MIPGDDVLLKLVLKVGFGTSERRVLEAHSYSGESFSRLAIGLPIDLAWVASIENLPSGFENIVPVPSWTDMSNPGYQSYPSASYSHVI